VTGTPATLSWSLPSVVLRILDRNAAISLSRLTGCSARIWNIPAAIGSRGCRCRRCAHHAGNRTGGNSLVGSTRIREQQVPWVMAALVSLALVASPVSWTHYQVLEYPGVALLLSMPGGIVTGRS